MTARATRLAEAPPETPDRVTLAYDDRHRRRGLLTTDAGREVLLDLAQASELRETQALVLEDGALIGIRAAPEPLTEVRARDPHHLARLAWHLGNRHLPVAIEPDRLLIRRDHVIEALLDHLGARLAAVEAPFTPEGGAYGLGRTHGHSHGPADHDPNAHLHR